MNISAMTELQQFAYRNPWGEANRQPPIVQQVNGLLVETFGLSLNK